ncbi:MAG: type II toxin-antitoxin system HicB family antitoxin [Rickettsiaceae bacterium]
MQYKEYYGSVHFDSEEALFYGKVEFIRDLVNYEGSDANSLIQNFHNAVDDYLEECAMLGKKPNIPFKGSFNIRINPELHRELSLHALQHNSSINNIVKSALEEFIQQH